MDLEKETLLRKLKCFLYNCPKEIILLLINIILSQKEFVLAFLLSLICSTPIFLKIKLLCCFHCFEHIRFQKYEDIHTSSLFCIFIIKMLLSLYSTVFVCWGVKVDGAQVFLFQGTRFPSSGPYTCQANVLFCSCVFLSMGAVLILLGQPNDCSVSESYTSLRIFYVRLLLHTQLLKFSNGFIK